jgi:hypothetical protein
MRRRISLTAWTKGWVAACSLASGAIRARHTANAPAIANRGRRSLEPRARQKDRVA